MNNLVTIKAYHQKIWDEKDLNAINEHFSAEAIIHSPVTTTKGIDDMRSVIKAWHTGFPDLHVTWEDYICEGDKVVSRWRSRGKQVGEFLGKEISNREVDYTGITIYQLTDNKIINYWANVDMLTLNKQLTD